MTSHEIIRTEWDGRVSLFECVLCSYRAELDHETGGYHRLDVGDWTARHFGSAGPVTLSVDVAT
jgi:hypothetical protein